MIGDRSTELAARAIAKGHAVILLRSALKITEGQEKQLANIKADETLDSLISTKFKTRSCNPKRVAIIPTAFVFPLLVLRSIRAGKN